MSTDELTAELERVSAEYDRLASHRPITLDSLKRGNVLRSRIIALERELCGIRGVQFLRPVEDLQMKWTGSFTDFHLHAVEKRAWLFLQYYVSQPSDVLVAQVTFRFCLASRLAFIDCDKLEGHSLFHSGLDDLGAYLVENSEWKREVGSNLEPSIDRSRLRHYFFCFNSSTAEFLAEGFDVASSKVSVRDALKAFCSGRAGD